jgi:hypothetical protein
VALWKTCGKTVENRGILSPSHEKGLPFEKERREAFTA